MLRAFTLIELLVVITIIVVLLAMLTPALDKAIYQAELTVCAGSLKAVAGSTMLYAFEHSRSYPDRPGIVNDGETPVYAWRPNNISDSKSWDDRPLLESYMPINQTLNCVLNEVVDFSISRDDTIIEADYNLWFGFKYPGNGGMMKIGNKVGWDGHRYSVIADDYDMLNVQANDDHATHPDRDGTMISVVQQDAGVGLVWTMSRWATNGTFRRGPMDRNFAYDDGSCIRLTELKIDPTSGQQDERLEVLPPFAESSTTVDHKNSLPRE